MVQTNVPSLVLHTARQQVESPYQRARDWVRALPWVRAPMRKARASDFRAIAGLGDTWGHRLDELRAPYRLVRWVATPRHRRDEVLRRYHAACKIMSRDGRLTQGAWRLLTAQFPPVKPRRRKTGKRGVAR